MRPEEFEEEVTEESEEEVVDLGEDLSDLSMFAEDAAIVVPLYAKKPDKTGKLITYRLNVPVKPLSHSEILKLQEGMRLPKGSRNILDATAIKKLQKYQVDIFNAGIAKAGGKLRFVRVPKGKANYADGELSIEDLSTENVRRLEVAISSGVSKSAEDFENELRAYGGTARPSTKKPQRGSLDAGGASKDTKEN